MNVLRKIENNSQMYISLRECKNKHYKINVFKKVGGENKLKIL